MKLFQVFVITLVVLFSSIALTAEIAIDGTEHYAFRSSEDGMSVTPVQPHDLHLQYLSDSVYQAMQASETFIDAYLEHFRLCIAPEDRTPPPASLIKSFRERQYLARRINSNDVILVTQKNCQSAFLYNGKTKSIISPPCSLFVHSFSVSEDMSLVALVAKDVKRTHFIGHWSNWWPEYGDYTKIYIFDFSKDSEPIPSIISTKDNIVATHIGSNGIVQVITAKANYFAWFNPINWLGILSGHPPQHTTYALKSFNRQGDVLSVHVLAKRVPYASARILHGH